MLLQQILTHSRVRDGIWLTPENLREIYAGLKADKDGNGEKSTLFLDLGFINKGWLVYGCSILSKLIDTNLMFKDYWFSYWPNKHVASIN